MLSVAERPAAPPRVRGRPAPARGQSRRLATAASLTALARHVPWAARHRARVACRVFDRFREDAINVIYSAQEEAMRRRSGTVCTEFILYGILGQERAGKAKTALVRKGVTKEAVKRAMSNGGGYVAGGGEGALPFSENARLLFDTANADAVGNVEIGCEQLLLALCEAKLEQSGAMQIISGLGVSGEQLRATVLEELSTPERELAAVGADEKADSELTLDQVATDLTQMAQDGLLDPVVGREEEMERIIQILLRKRKNNCCLVGPAGVGKTAVVEGLAQRIAQGRVPSRLRGKQLYSLDLGQLVAGTKYRGEFEDRLKKVIKEVTSSERDVCLFIDEIHQLIGAGAAGAESSMDAANLLKPSLARGELQVIGATTADEFAKHIEKDAALERRFQRVNCEEASVRETLEILEGLRPSYEAHHGVLLSPEALQAAARLSQRYLTNRFLPDKAVDLIDEASSLAQWRMEIELEQANEKATPTASERLKPVVSALDVAQVLSKWCGVPVDRLSQQEAERLMGLEELLARRIVGQQEAVSALCRAVRRARSGLAGQQRPTASFFFAGPSGVGKTELCRVLAEEYYADPKAMVRLDMSEFSEPHSVSRLIGAPPGYVGYNDPRSGQLTEAVRRSPYCVLVLDEIEKAHGEVLNLLLQLLEDGRLTDGKGRAVSFKNCIVVMTSNVGSKEILQQQGGVGSSVELRTAVQAQLQQKFRPEFLNRIDELLVFKALGQEQLTRIVQLLLTDAERRAVNAFEEDALQSGRHAGLVVRWTKGLEQLVIARGSNVAYGARPLRRAVQRLFEDPLAEFLVAGELRQGGEVVLDVEQEEVVVRYEGRVLRPSCIAKEVVQMPKGARAEVSQESPVAAVSVS